jgi:hemoglobin
MNKTDFIITKDFDGSMPKVQMPNPELLEFLGEEKFRTLVGHHYDLLVQSSINHLFPSTQDAISLAKKHAANFFIQILGGKDYYRQNRGEPMMRKRHMPFTIDMNARIVWLECYQIALSELKEVPDHLLLSYWKYIDKFSLWMINS